MQASASLDDGPMQQKALYFGVIICIGSLVRTRIQSLHVRKTTLQRHVPILSSKQIILLSTTGCNARCFSAATMPNKIWRRSQTSYVK